MSTLRANTIITDSGYPRYRIIAPTWLMFDNAQEPRWTFPDGMHMEQYDNEGNIHATIDCDSAVYFTGRQTWRLDGAVDIASVEGQRFLTQQLWWDRIYHEVYSDSFIHIERPDRVIEGFGFKSNDRMTRYVVLRPSGIFPTSQFKTQQDDDGNLASSSVDSPYDVNAAAAEDPTDAQRTDSAFNGEPTDTIYVSTTASDRPGRRAARDVLRRRTPQPQQRQPQQPSDTAPKPRLAMPSALPSAGNNNSATSIQQSDRQ